MKDLINRVFEEKLQDGTIEKIVSERIDAMINEICLDQMRWSGSAKKAMEEKLSPLILQAIENSDLSSMVTKITMMINASMRGSEVEQYHDVLQSVKNIFDANDFISDLRKKKVVRLSEIFERYKEYLNVVYDKDDFDKEDICDDGDSVTASVMCGLRVDSENDRGFSWFKPGYEVELYAEKYDNSKSGDIRFRLRWNYDKTKLYLQGDFSTMTLSELRHVPQFILYLATIERELIEIEVDMDQEEDMAEIDCRGY